MEDAPGHKESSVLNPKLCQLDSIFAEVEISLPSIDFDGLDLSDGSSDEDVAIFHRAIPTPTFEPADSKKQEDEVANCEGTDDTWQEIFSQKDNQNEDPIQVSSPPKTEKCSHFKNSFGTGKKEENGKETVEPVLVQAMRQNWITDNGEYSLETIHQSDVPDQSKSNTPDKPEIKRTVSLGSTVSNITENKGQQGQQGHAKKSPSRFTEVSKNIVSQYFQVPSMPQIDDNVQGDIDKLLSSSTCSERPRNTVVSSVIAALQRLEEDVVHGKRDDKSLIEKLAQLSHEQSGTEIQNIDPETGAVTRFRQPSVKHAKTSRNVTVEAPQKRSIQSAASAECDLAKKSKPKDSQLVQAVDIETNNVAPNTIYLDLRSNDKNKLEQKRSVEAVQRILHRTRRQQPGLSDDSDGDEKTDDRAVWHEQRRRIKQALKTTGKIPADLNITSLKEAKSKTKSPPLTHAQRLARPSQTKPAAAIDDVKPTTQEKHQINKTDSSTHSAPVKTETDQQKTKDTARKLRAQREQEHQCRQRLGKRLEVLRPQTSVPSGRQSPAEATQTLFDVEASYEPAPLVLPPFLPENVECTLLTVHLSTSGEVSMHRGSASKSIDLGHGFSATYATLLAWLVSLVPDNFDFLRDGELPPPASAPFHVLCLQQMYLDRQLCLHVAVCPSQNATSVDTSNRSKRPKKRDETKGSTPFQQSLSRFLTTNSLHNTCPWIQCIESMDVTSQSNHSNSSASQKCVYNPPLPNVTSRPLSTFIQMNSDPNAVRKVLNISIGFFWQTIEIDESRFDQDFDDKGSNYETQNTMSLVCKKVYRDPHAMAGILYRVMQEGLDLAGIRLLYLTQNLAKVVDGTLPTKSRALSNLSEWDLQNSIGPVLALGIRGIFARKIWLDAIGPSDPVLARKTDPYSLCALYSGESRDECLLFCPRNPMRVHSELVRWFGGRVPANGVIDVGTGVQDRPSSGNKKNKRSSGTDSDPSGTPVAVHKPPATLVSTILSEIFFVLSPLVPTRSIGLVLAICQRRGYQLRGVRRSRLTARRTANIGIPSRQSATFCSTTSGCLTPASPAGFGDAALDAAELEKLLEPSRPSTIFLLSKENAVHNSPSLTEAIMVEFSLQGVLSEIQEGLDHPVTSSLLFHSTPYSDSILTALGGNFAKVPVGEMSPAPGYIQPQIYSNPELEQIVVVTLTGHQAMKNFGMLLGQLQNLVPYKCKSQPAAGEGFEMLGLKWLPSLGLQQARELTPYEVGESEWKHSIHQLTSEPAVVIVLRGVNAFKRLQSLVSSRPTDNTSPRGLSLEKLMSLTPELAYSQVALFFHDSELFTDLRCRPLLSYLPPVRTVLRQQNDEQPSVRTYGRRYRVHRSTKSDTYPGALEESIFHTMLSEPRPLTTVVVVKPDVVRRNLGKLLKRVAHEGFKIVGMRLEMLGSEVIKGLIPHPDSENEVLVSMHRDYMTSAPSLLLCLQCENAVKKAIDLLGPADPQVAKRQNTYLWRAMFGSDPVNNGLYASFSYKQAVTDQKQFFSNRLCCKPTEDLKVEEIQCPAIDQVLESVLTIKRRVDILSQPAAHQQPLSAPICPNASSAKKNMGTSTSKFTYHLSALTQTNCVLLTPTLLQPEARHKKWPYIDIIDFLLTHGFDLVGARMIWFTKPQAECYLGLSCSQTKALVALLTHGPSIVLAVQRDNAVMAFDSLLGGPYLHEKESLLAKYGDKIMRSKDMKQASDHLAFFFDKLVPDAQVSIVVPSAGK